MFRLYMFSIVWFVKIRYFINRIIIIQKHSYIYFTKKTPFNILSLVKQLSQWKSTFFKGSEPRKYYFFEKLDTKSFYKWYWGTRKKCL